jgi:hypothetical protein
VTKAMVIGLLVHSRYTYLPCGETMSQTYNLLVSVTTDATLEQVMDDIGDAVAAEGGAAGISLQATK